jgi:hypothetical protein
VIALQPLEVARLHVPGWVDDPLGMAGERGEGAVREIAEDDLDPPGPGHHRQQLLQARMRRVDPRACAREVVRQPHGVDVLTREDHQRQPPARAQDPLRLGYGDRRLLDVVQHRDEHRRVDALVGERERRRVGLDRLQPLRRRPREHRRLAVDDHRVPAGLPQRPRVVAGPAADVGQPPPRRSLERLLQRTHHRGTRGARFVVRPCLARVVPQQARIALLGHRF